MTEYCVTGPYPWSEEADLRMRTIAERHRLALTVLLRTTRFSSKGRLRVRLSLEGWLSDGDGTPLPTLVVDFSNKVNRGIDKRTGRESRDLPGGTPFQPPVMSRRLVPDVEEFE